LLKYRLLIEETETVFQDAPDSRIPSTTVRSVSELSKSQNGRRSVYFDFVEL